MVDKRVVDFFVYKKLDEMTKSGQLVDPIEVERERIGAVEKLRSMGDDRFVEILNQVKIMEFDVKFFVTNESFDKGVMVKDLIALGQIAPQYSGTITKSVADLMGLDINQFNERQEQPVQPQQPQVKQMSSAGAQAVQKIAQNG